MQRLFAVIWPWSLIFYAILSIVLLGIPILGVNDAELLSYLDIAAALMFIPLILMIIGGFAYDIQRQAKADQYLIKSKWLE